LSEASAKRLATRAANAFRMPAKVWLVSNTGHSLVYST
jgi:hypothetical protein